MNNAIATLGLLFAAHTASHALTCDELKLQIGQKIQTSGVADYTLDIVDVGADASGKVVGSCNSGRSKIVYRKSGASDAAAVRPAPAAASRMSAPPSMVTECKPGFSGPDCTQQTGSR